MKIVGKKLITKLRKQLDALSDEADRDNNNLVLDDEKVAEAIHLLSLYVERQSWAQENTYKGVEKLYARVAELEKRLASGGDK